MPRGAPEPSGPAVKAKPYRENECARVSRHEHDAILGGTDYSNSLDKRRSERRERGRWLDAWLDSGGRQWLVESFLSVRVREGR